MTALLKWLSRLFWRPIPGGFTRDEQRLLAVHMRNAEPRSLMD